MNVQSNFYFKNHNVFLEIFFKNTNEKRINSSLKNMKISGKNLSNNIYDVLKIKKEKNPLFSQLQNLKEKYIQKHKENPIKKEIKAKLRWENNYARMVKAYSPFISLKKIRKLIQNFLITKKKHNNVLQENDYLFIHELIKNEIMNLCDVVINEKIMVLQNTNKTRIHIKKTQKETKKEYLKRAIIEGKIENLEIQYKDINKILELTLNKENKKEKNMKKLINECISDHYIKKEEILNRY